MAFDLPGRQGTDTAPGLRVKIAIHLTEHSRPSEPHVGVFRHRERCSMEGKTVE
jgi:hypothetical protein